ncbi:MAG: ribulose-phosphate 3-epimerase [Nitrososphaerales archaeon]
MNVKIAPSILAGDLSSLRGEVERAERGGADIIHLDVMDGHFAPNLTFGPGTVKALRGYSKLPFDAHLMISSPLQHLESFIEAGCDIISVHAEVCNADTFAEVSEKLKSSGRKVGIALNPNTDLPEWLMQNLRSIDLLNVMSVFPGFSGQKFMPEVLPRMSKINEMIQQRGLEIEIEADGGVGEANAYDLVRAGARVLVAGNSVYGSADVGKAIATLREKALLATKEV